MSCSRPRTADRQWRSGAAYRRRLRARAAVPRSAARGASWSRCSRARLGLATAAGEKSPSFRIKAFFFSAEWSRPSSPTCPAALDSCTSTCSPSATREWDAAWRRASAWGRARRPPRAHHRACSSRCTASRLVAEAGRDLDATLATCATPARQILTLHEIAQIHLQRGRQPRPRPPGARAGWRNRLRDDASRPRCWCRRKPRRVGRVGRDARDGAARREAAILGGDLVGARGRESTRPGGVASCRARSRRGAR